jgi:alpha-beta hydrolase superfamily lysophospholipase
MPAPRERAALELRGLRETPLSIPQRSGELFGVLAEPTGPAAPLCLVLVNPAAIRHTGPNRMWVELARRWAARGVPVLRLDVGGIGESDGPSERYADVAAFYVPELVGHLRAALDALEARGLGPRFVAGGLCSGAYWSFQAALEDERLCAALMINPRALMWDRWARSVAFLGARGAAVGSGQRSTTGHGSRRRLALALVRPWERARARRLDRALDRLQRRGAGGLMVFTGDEPLYRQFERDGRLTRAARWPDLSIELISATPETHTLRPLRMQREVHAALDRTLERELARSTARGPATS